MDLLIAAIIVVTLAVVMEVRAHKHDKPVRENLQAMRDLTVKAKPIRRPPEQNA